MYTKSRNFLSDALVNTTHINFYANNNYTQVISLFVFAECKLIVAHENRVVLNDCSHQEGMISGKKNNVWESERRGEKVTTRQEKWMDGRSQFGPPITTTQSSQFIIPCPSHPSIPFIGYFYLRAYTSASRCRSFDHGLFFFVRFASLARRRGAQ